MADLRKPLAPQVANSTDEPPVDRSVVVPVTPVQIDETLAASRIRVLSYHDHLARRASNRWSSGLCDCFNDMCSCCAVHYLPYCVAAQLATRTGPAKKKTAWIFLVLLVAVFCLAPLAYGRFSPDADPLPDRCCLAPPGADGRLCVSYEEKAKFYREGRNRFDCENTYLSLRDTWTASGYVTHCQWSPQCSPPLGPAQTIYAIVMIVVIVGLSKFVFVATCMARSRIRKRDSIPASDCGVCEDCCCSYWQG